MPSNSASAIVAHLNLVMPASSKSSVTSFVLCVLMCGRNRFTSIMLLIVRMFSFTRSGYTTKAGESISSMFFISYHSAIIRRVHVIQTGLQFLQEYYPARSQILQRFSLQSHYLLPKFEQIIHCSH